MRAKQTLILFTALPLLCLAVVPALAQDDTAEGSFTGGFQIGFREVDVNGNEDKYKEDINLDSSPALFNLHFDYVPEDVLRTYTDRIEVDFQDVGIDAYDSARVRVQKFGRYDLKLNRRSSVYFYNDIIIPIDEAGDPALARAGDFHSFDFQRIRTTADLEITATKAAKFNFGFNRYTKKGNSTTTLDVARDEFELDKPVDESLSDYLGGFEYSWDKVTLILEGRYRDYQNLVEMFLPGQSLGEDPEDPTILDYFFLDQPYDLSSLDYTARVVARPIKKLQLRFAGTIQDTEAEFTASEEGKGIDFTGAPMEYEVHGDGEINRDIDLFNLGLTYDFSHRWALLAGIQSNSLDQKGSGEFEAENSGDWKIDTSRYEIGVQFVVNAGLVLSGGLLQEERDLESLWTSDDEGHGEKETTDHTGYWFTFGYRPGKALRLTGEVESNDFDDPYTTASPTDALRYRVRLQYNFAQSFWVSGSYRGTDFENKNSGWDSSYTQTDLRLGYNRSGLDASIGYNNVDIGREIDQTVMGAPGFGGGWIILFPIRYTADADFIDGRVRWEAMDRLVLGGDLRSYDNTGSFGVERTDYRGWLEFAIAKSYWLHLGYRTVDYDEKDYVWDDYDADIAEVSIGYRW